MASLESNTIADLIYTALENPVQIGGRKELEIWVCALMAAWASITLSKPGRWHRLWRKACKSHGATSSQTLADKLTRVDIVNCLKAVFNNLRKENHD